MGDQEERAPGDVDFSQYAGLVVFPHDVAELTDTTLCPACFTPLPGTACSTCGLDLGHPAAFRLLQHSQDAAQLLRARMATIGRMRYETAQREARRETAVKATPPVSAKPGTARATGGRAPKLTTTSPAASDPASSGPRRSSIQVLLLAVGVSLLSIATIFFLVYAFITFGLLTRSIIIGAITIAAFVVAGLLRRRGLAATAEGIGTFAVVLIYLDAFAVRANDLLGLGSVRATTYWGITFVASAVAFIAWRRRTGPRSASIVGFATFAPGVGLVVAGATGQLEGTTSVFASLAAAAAAGVVHLAIRTRVGSAVERLVVLSTTSLTFLLAFLAALVMDHDSDWAPAFALGVVAAIAFAHAGLLARVPAASRTDADPTHAREDARTSRIFGTAFAGFAGAASALALVAVAIRLGDVSFGSFVPPVVGALLALLFEFGSRTLGGPRMRASTLACSRAAGVVAVLALLLPAFLAVQNTVGMLTVSVFEPRILTPTGAISVGPTGSGWGVAALAVVAALAHSFWRGPTHTARQRLVRWLEVGTILVAVPLLGVLWLVLLGYLVLAALALAVLLRRMPIGAYRSQMLGTLSAAAALGYLTSWSSQSTWLGGSLAAIAMLLVSRTLCHADFDRASLLGVAVSVALIAVAATAHQLAPAAAAGTATVNEARFVGILAIVLLAGAAAGPSAASRHAKISIADRRVAFWLSATAAGASAVIAHQTLIDLTGNQRGTLLLPEFGTSLAVGAALVAVLTLWVLSSAAQSSPEVRSEVPSTLRAQVASSAGRPFRSERIAAGLALAPALYLFVDALALALDLEPAARSATPMTAALLAAAGALTVTLWRPSVSLRWAREAGIAVVGIPAVAAAMIEPTSASWLVLVLGGLTALILAIDADGLFSSLSPRKHLGWLALTLATAGFWRRLDGDSVRNLEAYVLPLAGALVLIAVLTAVASRRRGAADPKAAPLLALGGLLVAILPLSVDAASGAPTRALAIGAASAALLLAGSFVARPARAYLDAASLSGAIGVLVLASGRAAFLLRSGETGPMPDAWLGAALLLLLIAAFGLARLPVDGWHRQRRLASEALGVIGMAAVLAVVLTLALDDGPAGRLGQVRIVALALVFSALHVVALTLQSAPFTRRLGFVAIGFASVAVLGGMRILDPIEWGTAPIALALLATGFAHLHDTPPARSWPWLGPGFAVLLLPSLVATIDDRPQWRLVVLGVIGVTVIVIGAVRRLGAPFLLGIAVVLIHATATFAPQIRAVYELASWWVWAGIGGVLLIVLAAQYEKRIQDFKSVAMKIGALR
ncbi:MAG: hypothetical protein ABI275_01315 [Terrimesophilobacter sp.]